MPTTLEALIIIISIILPGYLIATAWSWVIPTENKSDNQSLFDYIAWGFIYTFFVSIILIKIWPWQRIIKPVKLSLNEDFLKNLLLIFFNNPKKSIAFVILFAVGSLLLGFILGKFLSNWQGGLWIPILNKRIPIFRVNQFSNAWDELFFRTGHCTLYFIFKDGSKVCGIFHNDSRASASPWQKDIYLEKEILLDKDGNIKYPIEGKGLWINKDEIKYFKILPNIEIKEK